MNDPLRSKLNLMLTALVAFGIGLGIAARFDLTPPGVAQDHNPPLRLVSSSSGGNDSELLPMNGFAEIAEQITPAVVTIYVDRDIPDHGQQELPAPFNQFQQEAPPSVRGSGSGFIISEDGYIVTNNHVVEGADVIEIQLSDRRQFTAQLVGRDPTTDVALLKLDADGLTPVTLGSSDATRVGEWALAIGSPGFRGVGGPLLTTVTAGIVSAKGRPLQLLQSELLRNPECRLVTILGQGGIGKRLALDADPPAIEVPAQRDLAREGDGFDAGNAGHGLDQAILQRPNVDLLYRCS